jgi:anti-sigma B factor antagonist
MNPDREPSIIFDDGTVRVAVQRGDGEVIVRVTGELDVSSRDAHNLVLAHVAQFVTIENERSVVIDLQDVQFCDSTGILLLLRLQQQTEETAGKFALREPSAAVRRVLIAGGLQDLLDEG